MNNDAFTPLLPPGFHPMSLGQIQAHFVENELFRESRTRATHFKNLNLLVDRLRAVEISGELWLDGSFVTDKLDPRDLDLCLRFSAALYDQGTRDQVATIEWFLQMYSTHLIDGYLLQEYPPTHPAQSHGLDNYLYWQKQFGFSRNGSPQGIVVLSLK